MQAGRFAGLSAAAALATLAGLGSVPGSSAPTAAEVMARAEQIAAGGEVQPDRSAPPQTVDPRITAAMRRALGVPRSNNRRHPGTGWSVATDRRRAKKARNRARNRKAHR